MILVHHDAVMVLSTSVTTTTRMLSVLADAPMSCTDVSALLAVLLQVCNQVGSRQSVPKYSTRGIFGADIERPLQTCYEKRRCTFGATQPEPGVYFQPSLLHNRTLSHCNSSPDRYKLIRKFPALNGSQIPWYSSVERQ
jgi:hypothetical protein